MFAPLFAQARSCHPSLSSTIQAKDPHLPQLAETNPPQPMDVDGMHLFYDWIA
jgi:hypothetical protein